jgi:hypothetical protein
VLRENAYRVATLTTSAVTAHNTMTAHHRLRHVWSGLVNDNICRRVTYLFLAHGIQSTQDMMRQPEPECQKLYSNLIDGSIIKCSSAYGS